MYKFKLKEIEVGDTEIKGGKKSTVTDIDPETGAISWDVADVADFSSTYNALQQAREFLNTLEKTGNAKDDTTIDKFAEDIAKLFNAFRSHVRKNYPKEYERVLRLKENALRGPETKEVYEKGDTIIYQKDNIARSGKIELRTQDFDYYVSDDSDGKGYIVKKEDIIGLNLEEQSSTSQGGASFTPGEGAQYATPYAFRKNKKSKGAANIYYYKLGYKPVPKIKPKGFEVKQLFEYNDFQQKRINHFDKISQNLNDISKLLSNAKDKTIDFYAGNESEYKILYSTDYIFRLIEEIINKLKTPN